jgi:hypothetical protein
MATSETAIANSALSKLGADRIISLDDDSREARLLKEQFDKVRDDLLRSHPWNFATKRVTLAALPTAPVSDFTYAYQVPTDCMRVLEIDSKDDEWQREGQTIVTDSGSVSIRYVAKITDPGSFDPNFSEVLAMKLAVDICYALTQNATFREQLMGEYMQKLREARSFDAQEGGTRQVYANAWLNSRY